MPDTPTVAISRIDDISSARSIERAARESVENSCDFAAMCKGRSVVLKPNVYCPSPPPTSTDPRVIAALITLAKEAGARKITVAEGRSISTALFRKGTQTTRACFQAVGMDRAALENSIRKLDVKALFVSTTVNADLAERIAEDTGVKLVYLYSGSLSKPGGPADNYLALMRYNVSAIVEALK